MKQAREFLPKKENHCIACILLTGRHQIPTKNKL